MYENSVVFTSQSHLDYFNSPVLAVVTGCIAFIACMPFLFDTIRFMDISNVLF